MQTVKLTSAQKAARTRAWNKANAKKQEAIRPASEAYYAFAETLYPKRNRIINKAEAERDRIINEAKIKCERIIWLAMKEFDKTMEPLEETYTKTIEQASAICTQEMADFDEKQSDEIYATL